MMKLVLQRFSSYLMAFLSQSKLFMEGYQLLACDLYPWLWIMPAMSFLQKIWVLCDIQCDKTSYVQCSIILFPHISFIQLFSLAMLLVYVHNHLQKQISRIIFKYILTLICNTHQYVDIVVGVLSYFGDHCICHW